MNGKKRIYSEAAYVLGIVILALGTAMMERADFGVSMVVAPAYLLHLKVSQTWSWFSFGMAEYCMQAVLLVLLAIVMRKWKMQYFFSFCTALFYGFVLDGCIRLVGLLPFEGPVGSILLFVIGMILCAMAISLLFHTYVVPEAYELFVKEVSAGFGKNINITKTVYDCCSCVIAILLSFLFFGLGHFEGVKWGTILCALVNGTLIGICSKGFDKWFEFPDYFKKKR